MVPYPKKRRKKAINNNDDNIMSYIQRKILISDKLERIFTILFLSFLLNSLNLELYRISTRMSIMEFFLIFLIFFVFFLSLETNEPKPVRAICSKFFFYYQNTIINIWWWTNERERERTKKKRRLCFIKSIKDSNFLMMLYRIQARMVKKKKINFPISLSLCVCVFSPFQLSLNRIHRFFWLILLV